VLQGREVERAAVARLLDEAWASRGGALVLRGSPGAGKSALLADASARAEGMQVLRTQGIESESPLAFAALHRLLRPVLGHLDRLPTPQAHALRAAFGEEDGDGGDRFRVFLGTLSLLAEAAEDGPVLVLVDDAHWLDDASAAAMLFVARRLHAERLALLFAVRDGAEYGAFDGGDLPGLELRGLDEAAAVELVADLTGVGMPTEVAGLLLDRTGGNPLALVELSGALSAGQLSGEEPLPARLPLTEGVERAFLDRYRRLTADARTMLLVAAADDSGRVTTVQRAATALGAGTQALHEVERSGLLRVRDGFLRLRHPLVRSAVYAAGTSVERRRVHSALAEVMAPEQDADRRAWHRAAAAEEPDEEVAADLDRVAEHARQRGGLEAAAAAWERAAELTPLGDARASRLYAAARCAWLAAHPAHARSLADAAHRAADDPGLRADIARLRARVEWNVGSVQLGHRMVLEAAREVAGSDDRRAREMAMFGAAIASFGGASGVDVDPVALVPPPEPADPARVRCYGSLLVGVDRVAHGDWTGAAPALQDAFAGSDELGEADQDLLPNLGIGAMHLGDDEAILRYHGLLLSRARSTGALVMIIYSLARLAFAEIPLGRWSAAGAGAAEAVQLARGVGQTGLTAMPLAWLALLAALRGEETVEAQVREAEEVAARCPTGILTVPIADTLRWARGIAAADPATAHHHLSRISHHIVGHLAGIDRIEAALLADRPGEVAQWTRELDAFAGATGSAWAAAAAAHGRAVLADGREAERRFQQALEHHARSGRPVDRARTALAYGAFLRRSRRRVDARGHLRSALQTFEDLGAKPWLERTRRELRASGERIGPRPPAAPATLTAQELQVARLVGEGLSTREVAARLFLSPRTIDFHLRNVFTKLGVRSRAELARLSLS
jgi:DNA-binding CsgD family transcriptional regulator